MSTANLRNFVAVAEKGSFSEAASKLGLSQPAISLSIKHIEDEYKLKLFDRSHGKCRLTEEGSFLLNYARDVVDVEDEFYEALEKVKGEVSGRFEVVSSNIPGEYALPFIIGEFKERYPKLEFVLDISDTYMVIDMIKSGEKEIGFAGVKPDDPNLVAKSFCPDILVLITRAGDPLAEMSRVDKSDLQEARYVLREKSSGTRKIMLEALESLGVDTDSLNVAMELSSTSSVLSAVAEGAGISMSSCLAASSLLEQKKVVPLAKKGLVVRRDLYVVYHRGSSLSRAAEALMEFVEEKIPYLTSQVEKVFARCGQKASFSF